MLAEWLVVPGIIAAGFAVRRAWRATRRPMLETVARDLGLAFAPTPLENPQRSSFPEGSETLGFLVRGARMVVLAGTATNVLAGSLGGRSVAICDLKVKVPRERKPLRLTVCLLQCPRLPEFSIGINPTRGQPPPQPPALQANFRRNYFVDGMSPVQAEKLLPATVQNWFAEYPGWAVSNNAHGWLVVHREGLILPKAYRRTLETVQKLVGLLEAGR